MNYVIAALFIIPLIFALGDQALTLLVIPGGILVLVYVAWLAHRLWCEAQRRE